MWRWLALWGVASLALLTPALGGPLTGDQRAALSLRGYPPGTEPPPLSGSAIDGRTVTLEALRGHVVLVTFWASWCLECRSEMPALERLHRAYASRGLAVVGVNVRESAATARRYAGELGLTFPLVLDTTGRITSGYGVIGLPTTFVIDRGGSAVALAVGQRDWDGAAAEALVQSLLAEKFPGGETR